MPVTNVVIVHGMPPKHMYLDSTAPSPSNYHWIPWIQKQLLIRGIDTQTPEMPTPYEPDFEGWTRRFEREDISSETVIVGASGGGGFVVRWLSEVAATQVGKVVLLAPWLDPDRERTGDFFNFKIDPAIATRVAELVIFNSDNDGEPIQESVRAIREAVPTARYREFHLGHFGHWDMPSPEFHELLSEVLEPPPPRSRTS
jgi:uncharacterized protein